MSFEAWRYAPDSFRIVAEEVDTDDPAEAAILYARQHGDGMVAVRPCGPTRLRTEAARVYRVAGGEAVLAERAL